MCSNVRRYVALPQSRGGACFCTRGAMQGYDVVLFIVALAKTVTPAGSPQALPGAACAALVLNFEICIIPHIVKKRLTSCIH